jgi:hypothetical protein
VATNSATESIGVEARRKPVRFDATPSNLIEVATRTARALAILDRRVIELLRGLANIADQCPADELPFHADMLRVQLKLDLPRWLVRDLARQVGIWGQETTLHVIEVLTR